VEIGLVLPQSGPASSPSFIRDFAQAAEESGIDGLWAVDHLVLPHHTSSPYVLGRKPAPVADGWLSENLAPNYEMLTTLTWVAGQTTTIGLGTSVAVLPIRNPIANARQLATLDAFSDGRLTYGVGVGWLREEADAMGMPWDRRGARSEEHVSLLRTLWCATDSYVEFHGDFYDFSPMDPRPQPVQRPIPILIGGHSAAALSRAVRIGDGWISAPMPHQRLASLLDELWRLADEHGRSQSSIYKVASATSDPSSFAEDIGVYRRLGIDRLQVVLPNRDAQQTMAHVCEVAAVTGT
jgi:probable F420-dependent oxidoreductase